MSHLGWDIVPEENERKYLVQSAGWRKQAPRGEHYRQGYLSTDPERSVRIRAGNKNALLTIKGGTSDKNSLSRAEFEYPIPLEDAEHMLDHLCRQPLIEKTRFRIPQDGHVWEVDQFEHQNQGLVLAEIEMPNGAGPKHLPKWVGEEVSQDTRYANANLVEHPYSEWGGRSRKPEAKYHWKTKESIPEGFRRIVSEELQLAVWQLSESGGSLDEAVHEARKSVKKIRSAVRLVQSVLAEEYDKENAVLRQAGRKLSPLRDAQALIEICDELDDRSAASARDGLVKRKSELERDFKRRRLGGQVLKSFREVGARLEKWPLQKLNLQAISSGFVRTIRRNRKAFENAYAGSDPESFHEWRKRAKDLRYHLALLSNVWPEVMDGYENSAKDLEHKLGDDHNLLVLRDTILESPHDFGGEKDIRAFLKIVEDRQQQLRAEAKSLGTRLYSEKPKRWRRRLELCWDVWKH